MIYRCWEPLEAGAETAPATVEAGTASEAIEKYARQAWTRDGVPIEGPVRARGEDGSLLEGAVVSHVDVRFEIRGLAPLHKGGAANT